MKFFFRLLSYSVHYKYRFTLGIVFALLTAVLNAVSLTALIPLFDSLGNDKQTRFQLQMTLPEQRILLKQKVFGKESLDGLERTKLLLIDAKEWVNNRTKGLEPKEVVWSICIIVMPLYLLKLITYLLSVFCIATAGYKAVRDIRQELFEKNQLLPLTYFFKEKTGLMMSRIINDVEIVAAVISSNFRDATINFFYVVTHLMVLLYLNTELLLIACLTVPVIILPVTLFTRKITKSTARFQEKMADLNANIQEMISGIKVIRVFNSEKYEQEKFGKINQNVYRRNFKGQFYLQISPSLVELTSSIVVLGFFAAGASLIYSGRFTQGEFMAFLLTLLFLLRPLTQLSQMVGKITQSIASGKRIFEIIDLETEDHSKESKVVATPLAYNIEFKNLFFAYPGTGAAVLKDINLKVKKGETIALIGASGCGKSTLMDLIPRFFDPSSGSIEFDGIDIRDVSLGDLRKKIGIVTQDIFLFHGSVADNIAYGKPGATRKDVIRAARLAHAHDFIKKMDNGYDSILGVRGLNLSGGQRQRLVIARALLRDPEIMILDEATSALDVESERLVSDALRRLYANRTTFVIAHRLSTIKDISRIVVMDNGKIVEEGDHNSLYEQNGIYRKLSDNQFAANNGVLP
ncbi:MULTISPECIES: ABC transporter ATP-binding protein [Leptospira]|uniref:ABC transporter transmembrane region n=3 Tax=Leptospira weilii TaxID=28184 RepID=A0A828Z5U3_9LEPT|nr:MULTISPECIES: ABC transporter ATP-binding protein [Leptospira]EMM71925.1 ABC transporter transmembrane region [Leptospira weilii str. 2006001855]EKR65747.1 ABC transporter transmembrane region [Leptospira weilii str. 2006001853]EMJ60753.1 ABC transporter transmembrane region [Leptospira sp. P2653]EMN88707.1 ABC transporter transmembrane region [Leptospira weilii str. UI 13098]MDL5245722.1 ABC transporter ATP-binding protein [Leptospira weilii]